MCQQQFNKTHKMTQLRLKKTRIIKLIIIASLTFYTISFLIGYNSDPEKDITRRNQMGLDMIQQQNFGAFPKNDNQSPHNKLGISETTYLFRKERFEKYQSTMFQVRLCTLRDFARKGQGSWPQLVL